MAVCYLYWILDLRAGHNRRDKDAKLIATVPTARVSAAEGKNKRNINTKKKKKKNMAQLGYRFGT